MLEQIGLINFQAHANSVLKLHEGVNVIVGSSDRGKTSIARALRLLNDNKPAGESFKRRGAKDMEVFVIKNGKKISRKRTKEENIYLIENEKYEGFGQGVPEDVTKALNFSELNMQYQMDTPFLLSKTSGEVSRFLNKITQLDDIDVSLKNLTSMKRKVNEQLSFTQKEIALLEQKIEAFPNFDVLEKEIALLEQKQKEIEKIKTSITLMDSIIEEAFQIEAKIQKQSLFIKSKSEVDKAFNLSSEIDSYKNKIGALSLLLKTEKEIKKEINKKETVLQSKDLVEKTLQLLSEIEDKTAINNSLDLFLDTYVLSFNKIEEQTKDLKLKKEQYQKLMPEECPLCGK